ncbi:C40 family peptidase [Angustibacter luteus]|uniref:C40 family peptidase n=1 Tax=Angustibacter luteus TaxID=658456 RepID=A0ABW1JJZ7_9ACTN
MTATRRVIHPALFRLVIGAAVAVGLAIPLAALSSSSADAAVSASVGMHAVKVAATRKGARYHHGSQGPKAFDCSGLTRWSYLKVGKRLPRTAQGQWNATAHIRKTSRRAGDLVFFFHGKHVYHVAIYAGHGKVWHAPRPGKRVKKVPLWTSHVRYGRVR